MNTSLPIFMQVDETYRGGDFTEMILSIFSFGIISVILIVYLLVYLISSLFIFEKAGRHFWEALIPFYNMWISCKIVGRNVSSILLVSILASFLGYLTFGITTLVLPLISIVMAYDLAMVFGYSSGFGLAHSLMTLVGFPVTNLAIAFGNNKYLGPLARGNERWFMKSPWLDPNPMRANINTHLDSGFNPYA